jgi:hypothetical protein
MDWAVKDQESWYHLRRAYLTLVLEKMQVLDYVGRYIGGQYFHRAHKGETKAPSPFVLVEPEKQRAALRFIADHLFSDTFFALKPDVLNHLAPARWYHEGASMDVFVTFPVMEYISLIQWWNLVDRLAPPIISRIHDSELKTDAADRFTVAEYLQTLQKAVWSDATDGTRLSGSEWTDAKPFLSAIRRSLQREYLGIVEPIVRSRPGNAVSPDIHAMFVFNLQTLSNQLGESLRGRLDFASKAHLSACKSRIDRMLSSELREF